MYKNNFVVVLKHNGQILREIDDIISLPFNSEYSLAFKNLNSRKALVDVKIDGRDVLDKKRLIIDGNSETELKGFMDGMTVRNKFKFIKKTKEISEYRGDHIDDSLIHIEFQFEKPIKEPEYTLTIGPISYQYNNYMDKDNGTFFYDNEFHNFCNTSLSNSVNIGSTSRTLHKDIDMDDSGITVKGSQCNQGFREGYIGELESSSYVITLKLKGITDSNHVVYKPITVRTKFVCETCGKASRSHARFCSRCGTSLV